MTGPMQWTNGGLVPANGSIPGAGETKHGYVDDAVVHIQPVAQRVQHSLTRPHKPLNVLALAKARLREVKAEIKRLRKLEKEQGELERLISAAEKSPRSNLREIKKAVGA